jgi:hypothetical protein
VITFRLDASVHDEATGLRLVLDNASGRTLKDLWLVFDGYAYELGSIEAGARIERGFIRRTHGLEVGEASWKGVLKPPSGVPVQTTEATRILLERKAREMRERGYPGSGHALLIGYAENPFRPAGASADWPRREQALIAFRVAALPGNAAAGADSRH